MERLLDTKNAADFLKVSEMTIRRWTNSGKLKCYRVGGKRERRFYLSDLETFLQEPKSHDLKPLGITGQKVPDGSHMTHFYSGKEDSFEVSIPYLLEGIKQGEALLIVMPAGRSRILLDTFKDRGYPVEDWLDTGRLTLSAGMDSPEEMIRYLVEFAVSANGFRILGDMFWTFQNGWDLKALSVLEKASDRMPPIENGLLLCQYGLDDFSGAAVMMAAEWHRKTIYKGRLVESPYYVK